MSDPILVEKRLRIETLSALHIGTGETLKKKDYARQGSQIFVARPDRVLSLAEQSPQMEEAFLDFCEDERQSLTDFLEEQKVRPEDISAYRVSVVGPVSREVLVFIKTAENWPYLPGSTLKGAVRSALFRSRLLAEDEAYLQRAAQKARADLKNIRQEVQRHPQQQQRILAGWRKKIGGDVERVFFGPDEHHDLMRCLQFGDSVPREPADLRVVEVRVLSISGGSLRVARDPWQQNQPMRPITPEVLRKGIKVICPLTVNLYLLGQDQPANTLGFGGRVEFIQNWLAECNQAAADLIQQEIDFFDRYPFNGKRPMRDWYQRLQKQLDQIKATGNQCLLHIAWGSGWDAKTGTDQFDDELFGDVRETLRLNVGRPRVFDSRQHRLVWDSKTLLSRPDSPKSRKIVFENGQPREPLGWVKLTLEEGD